jgi:hypothetical protein
VEQRGGVELEKKRGENHLRKAKGRKRKRRKINEPAEPVFRISKYGESQKNEKIRKNILERTIARDRGKKDALTKTL